MSTTPIYDWPRDWYGSIGFAAPSKFRLRSMSQVAPKPWSGAQAVSGPHAQVWMADLTTQPVQDPLRQDVEAFFARLRGRSGLLRFANPTKLEPWFNRNATLTVGRFSDGTTFTDGTGFGEGNLPPIVYVAQAAAKGARYLVLKGFPASIANALRRGDPLEVVPNGITAAFPHYYAAMYGGGTDASGQIGVAIEPGLRAGVAAGDPVNLSHASSVFRLVSDDSGEMDLAPGFMGSVSFSIVEALDLVP